VRKREQSAGKGFMSRVRDVSFIRKLCTLGLPAQTVAQCLLPELRKFIPSHSAGVFWVDTLGEMTSLYAERMLPPDAMAAYYERHYAVKAESFSDAFRRRAQSADPISSHSFSRAEQNTEYFRDVMRRLDAYHVLYGVLKDGTRPLAQISFYRGVADNSFDKQSTDTLRSVIRYLAIGLGTGPLPSPSEDSAVVVEEDLGIVSVTGAMISAPDTWQRLLRLAALAEVRASGRSRRSSLCNMNRRTASEPSAVALRTKASRNDQSLARPSANAASVAGAAPPASHNFFGIFIVDTGNVGAGIKSAAAFGAPFVASAIAKTLAARLTIAGSRLGRFVMPHSFPAISGRTAWYIAPSC
jgi:hypothetical protein